MSDHVFISYSTADALDFAHKLANKLEGGTPSVPVWFDKDDLKAGREWDIQIDEALKSCKLLLFVMTKDSTHEKSVCRQEWSRALSFKKIIVPLWVDNDIDVPFRLADRQRVDFRGDFDRGLAQLRDFLMWLDSPEGILQGYKDRLLDAERDLQRASEADKLRIQADIEDLKAEITRQEKIVANPQAAAKQTQINIETGLERERHPEKPTKSHTSTKFINPPPGIAPNYFQDREVETAQVVKFLQDDSQRMMTIVGRGGVGKTAMVCRLLKGLEGGELPDGLGNMRVEGIVYLSESGSHRVNFANLFYDLCKLLPSDAANALDAVYKNPQASTASKMNALLDRFTTGKVVLLLDNVEPLISVETFDIADAELDECLRALLHGAHSALKVILTTRVAPRGLNLCEPGRQRVLTLDSGLEQKYAVEMLREMDVDGKLGLKSADAEALKRAYERTLGFPRALEALFAILASDRYTTLDELLAMPTPVNVVEALVGEAFNRLDTNAQKVMQALAVYNRPVTPAAVDYLLAPHLPAIDSAPILQRLANMHFARKESGRFYLHPVDREFAFGLIPEKDLTTTLAPHASAGEDTKVTKEEEEVSDVPDVSDVIKAKPADAIPASEPISDEEKKEKAEKALSDLKALLAQMKQQQEEREERETSAFTQQILLKRAANYYKKARKPRAEWKKLDDLSAQLAEFDLRCAAGDYDTAASVLLEIDFDYLLLWGHFRPAIKLYEKIYEHIIEKSIRRPIMGNMGITYYYLGQYQQAIIYQNEALKMADEEHNKKSQAVWANWIANSYSELSLLSEATALYERSLNLARELNDKGSEGVVLGNLGGIYLALGDTKKAIEYHEKALLIAQKQGTRKEESVQLENIGYAYLDFTDYEKVQEYIGEAIKIADDISFQAMQLYGRWRLSQAYLVQNDLILARKTIQDALQYDSPQYNHDASALHGIIALRQGDEVTARGAFVRAIGQADEILSKTAEYYSALDAKGLALCGLALCRSRLGRDTNDAEEASRSKRDLQDAFETFRKARRIAPHAGIVKSVLRLFDELVKCDTEGILKDVREAVEGK